MADFRFEEFCVAKPHLFDSYVERLDCMFAARETAEDKKSAVLLSVVGADVYQIARNLTSPALPSTKSYSELTTLLAAYFKPKVNVVAQRFRFHKRQQAENESCNAYMSALRELASPCDYGDFLDQMLRDRFVCGLRCERMQSRCLAISNLTLEKAYEIASVMEGAKAGLTWMRPAVAVPLSSTVDEDTVAKIYQGRSSTRQARTTRHVPGKTVCYRCRAPTHLANECPLKNKTCHFCGKVGHVERACLMKEKQNSHKQQSSSVKCCARARSSNNSIYASDNESSDDSLSINHVSKINRLRAPYVQNLFVNDKLVPFEIDTGTSETIMNKITWEQCGSFELSDAPKLQTYTGGLIPTLGQGVAYFQTEDKPNVTQKLHVIVVKSSGDANLLGRKAIEKLKIDLTSFTKKSINENVNAVHSTAEQAVKICENFTDVFKDELGLLKGYHATLTLKQGATPKFGKPILPTQVAEPRKRTEGSLVQAMRVNSLPVTADEVANATRRDKQLSKVLYHTRHGWPDSVGSEMRPFFLKRYSLSIEQDVLLLGIRVVVPESLRDRVLQQLHDTHPGVARMKGIARSHVWWPELDHDIEYLVKGCQNCQLQQSAPTEATVHPLIWPQVPWYRLHIDYAGPFFDYMWLVVVDATSKWAEIIPVREATSTLTIKALEAIFARFGLPMQIFSDNGAVFTSDEFRGFCERLRIHQIFSTPFHPRSNGEAERMVKTFKSMIKKANPGKSEIMSSVSSMLLDYRTTPHATTGVSPCELLFKATPRTIMHRIHPAVESRVLSKQLKQHDESITSCSEHLFLVGERVWVKDFRARFPNKWVAGTVVARRGPLSYVVQVGTECWRRHIDQMRGSEFDQCQQDQPHAEITQPELNQDELIGNQNHDMVCDTTADVTTRANTNANMQASAKPASSPSVEPGPSGTPGSDIACEMATARRYPKRERHPPARFGFEEKRVM